MKLNFKKFGTGEPLIVMHGLFGMLDNWQAPARVFAEHFETYIIDLRNHGHSPHSDIHNYDAMAEDVMELMDHLNIEKTHLLGHSMGGKVAMKVAQLHPKRLLKLIVADIGPKYYPVHHDKIIAGMRAVPLGKLEKRTDADEYMAEFISEPAIRQFLAKSLFHPDRHSFAWRFNLDAIENQIESVGQSLEELDFEGETLFIRGGNSNYIKDSDWPDIKTIFPNAYLETIEGAGHWLHAEKPEAFTKAVVDFILG